MNHKVRRNVTIDKYLADRLEMLSDVAGFSQGKVIETALNQPIMRRLFAFVTPPGENDLANGLANLLDIYQQDKQSMNPRIGETLLQTANTWVEMHAIMKNDTQFTDRTVTYVNSYLQGHMTKGTMDADPYFKTVYEQAMERKFISLGMKPAELKDKVNHFIDVILWNPHNEHLMGEAFLFRDLSVILSNCFQPPTISEMIEMLNVLCDGHVLPYRNTMSQ